MAQRPKPYVQPFVRTITREGALARLTRLLEQMSEFRTANRESHFVDTWRTEVRLVLNGYYGPESMEWKEFHRIEFSPNVFFTGQPQSDFVEAFDSGTSRAEGFLKSRIAELREEVRGSASRPDAKTLNMVKSTHKVFLVHGHDHGSKETVARYLTKLELEPIILHERPDQGRTIIEKFEHYAEVGCAVVILSPDDVGHAKSNPTIDEERARQNVIFEMGFFVGKLGRSRTFALLLKGVTRPSDIDGVLYIPMGDDGTWKMSLVRELKAANLDVDANKAFG